MREESRCPVVSHIVIRIRLNVSNDPQMMHRIRMMGSSGSNSSVQWSNIPLSTPSAPLRTSLLPRPLLNPLALHEYLLLARPNSQGPSGPSVFSDAPCHQGPSTPSSRIRDPRLSTTHLDQLPNRRRSIPSSRIKEMRLLTLSQRLSRRQPSIRSSSIRVLHPSTPSIRSNPARQPPTLWLRSSNQHGLPTPSLLSPTWQ